MSEGTDAALLHSYSVFVCNDFCVFAPFRHRSDGTKKDPLKISSMVCRRLF